MFCAGCYASLAESSDGRCPRCGRPFDAVNPSTFLRKPFPPRRRILVHTLITLALATVASIVVAGFASIAQMKYINSNH